MTAQVHTGRDPARVLDEAISALHTPGSELPLDDVEQALRAAPYDARLWHIKGLIHREHDRRELAVPALRRAVDLAPSDPLIVHGLARTLLEAGLSSIEMFARAMKLSPDKPEVVTGMVAALVAEGRVTDAIAGVELVVRRTPLWVAGHALLADLRWTEGERDGFARSFDEALAVHPNSLDLRGEQLVTLLHAGQFDEVLDRVDQGRKLFGELPMFTSHEATVRAELGDTEAADRLFAQLTDLRIPNVELRRVRHLLRSGRPAPAAKVLDEWLGGPDEDMFWPYAATAWRMLDDPRVQWLEGDPPLVGVYDLSERLPPLDKLAATLRKLHTTRGQPLVQSLRGGTQTDGQLFHRIEPEIVALREVIREAVAEHARNLPPVDPGHPLLRWRPETIRFNGSWSVRLQAGGFHANHVHPFGWLSSALYILLPPDLEREHAGWLTLGEPQAELKLDLPPHRLVEPKPGRLVLFPSWMWHGTRPFGEGERMTVAFDVARD